MVDEVAGDGGVPVVGPAPAQPPRRRPRTVEATAIRGVMARSRSARQPSPDSVEAGSRFGRVGEAVAHRRPSTLNSGRAYATDHRRNRPGDLLPVLHSRGRLSVGHPLVHRGAVQPRRVGGRLAEPRPEERRGAHRGHPHPQHHRPHRRRHAGRRPGGGGLRRGVGGRLLRGAHPGGASGHRDHPQDRRSHLLEAAGQAHGVHPADDGGGHETHPGSPGMDLRTPDSGWRASHGEPGGDRGPGRDRTTRGDPGRGRVLGGEQCDPA